MLSLLQYLNHFALAIAVFCGIAALRYMPRVWRILLLQLIVALTTEIWGLYLSHIHRVNTTLYNSYIVIEVVLLGMLGIAQLRRQFRPYGMGLLLSIFIANLVLHHQTQPGEFNDIAFLINCIFLTALYLAILLMLQIGADASLFRQPILYLCIGTVLYFGCDIPYMSLRTYLVNNNPELGTILHLGINTGLATIRYLLAGVALFLFYVNHSKQRTITS